jgi:hypothetical protein
MSECPKCNGMKIQLSTMTGLSGIWACIDCDFTWTIEAEREIESLKGKLVAARGRLEEIGIECSGNALPLTLPTIIKAVARKGLEESK